MIVVADTGPIVHLYWIHAAAWALPPQPIYIVDPVWDEVKKLDFGDGFDRPDRRSSSSRPRFFGGSCNRPQGSA